MTTSHPVPVVPVALVTGGSAGLGLALTSALTAEGWTVVLDGRDADRLRAAAPARSIPVTGDVADPAHRAALVSAVRRLGRLDLLVHAASTLGPLPLRPLAEVSDADLEATWRVNAAAPHALTRDLLPELRASAGVLLSLSSDAAVEHYDTWGAYAATKAALDQLTLTAGAEEAAHGVSAYALDPGDMRTQMHQDAFPGEDISDRPLPDTVVPQLLALLRLRPPSGRFRAADVPVLTHEGAAR